MTVPSYPAPGFPEPSYPAAGPRPRPTVVTAASYLLYTVAGLELIGAIMSISVYSRIRDALQTVYAGTAAAGAEGLVSSFSVVGAIFNVFLGVGFGLLGFFDAKGKNPARIVTWVIGGLSLCCVGAGLGGSALTSSINSSRTGGPSQLDVQQSLNDALPSWYQPVTTTISAITLLCLLATIVLLALPAANNFFRRQPVGWDPAMQYASFGQQPGVYPGAAQPGAAYPSQQPYPGQPQAGQPQPGQAPFSDQPYPGQSYPAQPYPAQPYPAQPYPGQPYSGQPPYEGQPGQPAPGLPPYPGQPVPGQPYSEQPYPAQPYSGQPPYSDQPAPGQQYPGQPYPAEVYPGQALPPQAEQSPYPPASDPYAPPADPPPVPPSGDQPPKAPTDPA